MEECVSVPKFNLNKFLKLLNYLLILYLKIIMILIQILKNVKKMMDQVGYKNYQYATVEFVKKIIYVYKVNIIFIF